MNICSVCHSSIDKCECLPMLQSSCTELKLSLVDLQEESGALVKMSMCTKSDPLPKHNNKPNIVISKLSRMWF